MSQEHLTVALTESEWQAVLLAVNQKKKDQEYFNRNLYLLLEGAEKKINQQRNLIASGIKE